MSSRPAVHCPDCQTIYEYEIRDEFQGEIFCPVCTSRTPTHDRGPSSELSRQYPQARVYQSEVRLLQRR